MLSCFNFAFSDRSFTIMYLARLLFTAYARRLNNFYTWLSNTLPVAGRLLNMTTVTLCRQYSGSVPASATVFVKCILTLPAFRYVIIATNLTNDQLTLAEVAVYTG